MNMNKTFYRDGNLTLTRYAGKDGINLQITTINDNGKHGWVQLTEEQWDKIRTIPIEKVKKRK